MERIRPNQWRHTLQSIFALGAALLVVKSAFTADEFAPRPFPASAKYPHEEFYSPSLRRLNISGRVLLEFSIDKKGKTSEIRLVKTEAKELVSTAAQYLQRIRYNVPKDWVSSDGSQYRRLMTIAFVLRKGNEECTAETLAPSGKLVTICAQEIPEQYRQPIR